ncbi:T9SS type A sorting domain-containing protein [bacterium]|nr:T9SS type A sorting domain-containing protein [bacterium]
MTKLVSGILLAVCLVAAGVAFARVAHSPAASSGATVSVSAGKELRSAVGLGIEPAVLSTGGESRAGGVSAGVAGPMGSQSTSGAVAAGLRPNRPNPFAPATSISYAVDGSTHVRLAIYDVSGRLVRTLAEGLREGGRVHTVSWGGDSDRGEELPSGVYFCRIETERFTQMQKMVLLR